jgi:5-formyltetrahydrofolate cyclo-ligase
MSGSSKGLLRREMQSLRDSIPRDEKQRLDEAIVENLFGWNIFKSAKHIFCYMSFRSEIDTLPVIHRSLMEKKVVSVPKIDLSTKQMRACIIEDTQKSLKPGSFGILEPIEGCSELSYENLQLIVAPGLAFTRRGERLGYGGGFYDRFIECHNHIPVCSLIYNRLILEELPVKDHDLPVDYLITESGVIYTRRGAR